MKVPARVVALVAACGVAGSCASTISDGGARDGGADARVGAQPKVDASPDADATPADAARDEPTPGTFGHCCVDDLLVSCFCPSDASCMPFGVACADGGCVAGEDAAGCPPPEAGAD